ncbi:hypothetical protein XU18_4401 [Perkinsela sp. CCAP 1560/4]|nr:hypothetical protein XU18_4401 [Perkinsela sp. CCAP 1560/4]|eukprot:KNH04311.1 hypothetical protein XU18_4401 [Perkinsela sp. CCAP 1560/4]
MAEGVKVSTWDMYLNEFTDRISVLERTYEWPKEDELSGDLRDRTRAVRFSADAVSYIQRVTQEFIQDFVFDAVAIAEVDRKRTVNFYEHILPMVGSCLLPERTSESIKRRDVREHKISQINKKWEFLGDFFTLCEKEPVNLGGITTERDVDV